VTRPGEVIGQGEGLPHGGGTEGASEAVSVGRAASSGVVGARKDTGTTSDGQAHSLGGGRGLRAYLALGVGLSILAFLVHGLLDSFLAFNATAWLFWLLLGFASVLGTRRRA
jgi:hypothetical protein